MHWGIDSISKIKELKLSHRNWKVALSHLHAMLIASSPGEVVCLSGPSRGGKTRLINEVETLLICGDDYSNSDYMPVVKILATNCSVGGTFSSKSFTLRALNAVQHPFYSNNSLDSADWGGGYYKQLARTPETTLRLALEEAIKNRKTQYIFIDEAQHVLYSRRGEKDAAGTLESWKCLAQSTGVVLVLVGAYPLLDAIALCPHMISRKHQVHIPRYYKNDDDVVCFLNLLHNYSKYVKLDSKTQSLKIFADYLYEGSFGCIGLLESWIREALAYAMADDAKYLLLKHFEMSFKIENDRKMVAAEIQKGEKYIFDNNDSNEVCVNTVNKKKGNPRPFEKNPRRNKISGRH